MTEEPPHHSQATIDCLDVQLKLIEYSVGLLKTAGFRFGHSSMKSEACYYRYGDKAGLLRVAGHSFGKAEARMLAHPVWSCLTFPKNGPRSVDAVHGLICAAVGIYFMYPQAQTGRNSQKVESLWEAPSAVVMPPDFSG